MSIVARELAHIIGLLTTIFSTDVASFILLVTVVTADNVLSASSQPTSSMIIKGILRKADQKCQIFSIVYNYINDAKV